VALAGALVMQPELLVLDGQRGIVCRYCVEDRFEQDEMLREANVAPPILSELFGELRQRGVNAKTPVTVSQAAKNLLALIRDGNGRSEDTSTPRS